MHWLPEKVEGKLFVMTLAICVGTSLFASQVLLSTEEESLLSKTKRDLESLSQQHEFTIINELSERAEQGVALGETIQAAWSSTQTPAESLSLILHPQTDGSQIGVSTNLISSGYVSAGTEVSSALNARMAMVSDAFEAMMPEYLSFFRNVTFISVDNVCISSPASQSSLIPSGTNLVEHPVLVDIAALNRRDTKPFWTPVRLDPDHSLWLTTLVVPLFKDDTLMGILTSDYSLNPMFSRITPSRPNEASGRSFIFRGKDELILHSELGISLQNSFRETGQGISATNSAHANPAAILKAYADTSPEHPFTYRSNGKTHVAHVNLINHNDWTLVMHMSTEHIEATIGSIRWKLTTGALLVAFVLMFLMRDAFHRLFLRRILDLEQATHDYATNEEFVIPNPGKDEIGQLAYSFQGLIHSLESGKARISEQAHQLEAEIEDRLQVLDSLEESETKFRSLFEQSSDAILLLGEEQGIDCNDAAIALFQFDQKDLFLDRPFLSFAPERQSDGSESREEWQCHARRAFKQGKHHFEWEIQTDKGTIVWVDILMTTIPYEGHEVLHAVVRDITDRKSEEMERVRLTTAIEQAAESIMVTDTAGNILYVNPAFEEFNQYIREDVLETNCSLLYGAPGFVY